ncbi:MAG TPA: hypothetical protein VFQ47_09410 [Nitrososphaera sp.]|jgi:ABC-type branched-subunit amino acid transport system permease subunit|nr:hypothetical protein [Nitrososphaera sp.]
MDDDFKEILWFILSPILLGVIFFPLEYIFQFWLSKPIAFGLAAFIAGLLSYVVARKTGISFSAWAVVGLSFAVVVMLGALDWLPDIPYTQFPGI